MKTGSGDFTYRWIENWIKIPDSESTRNNGRTHGVTISGAGDVYIFNQADPGVLVYMKKGN